MFWLIQPVQGLDAINPFKVLDGWNAGRHLGVILKNPDPSLGLRVPIPSEKNRNVGVIPFLGHARFLSE